MILHRPRRRGHSPRADVELRGGELSDAGVGDCPAKRGRPRSTNPKEHVSIRLDADVLRAFKTTGRGWQTRLNDALRDWLSTHA